METNRLAAICILRHLPRIEIQVGYLRSLIRRSVHRIADPVVRTGPGPYEPDLRTVIGFELLQLNIDRLSSFIAEYDLYKVILYSNQLLNTLKSPVEPGCVSRSRCRSSSRRILLLCSSSLTGIYKSNRILGPLLLDLKLVAIFRGSKNVDEK